MFEDVLDVWHLEVTVFFVFAASSESHLDVFSTRWQWLGRHLSKYFFHFHLETRFVFASWQVSVVESVVSSRNQGHFDLVLLLEEIKQLLER